MLYAGIYCKRVVAAGDNDGALPHIHLLVDTGSLLMTQCLIV